MDYLDGQYVFVKKVLPDLKDAVITDMFGQTYEKTLLNDTTYSIPVELTDSEDYSVIVGQDAYLSNRDDAGKSVATVMIDAEGNKMLYLQLQPYNGQYVQSVKYLNGSKLTEAAQIERYMVDGINYPKLVALPISDDAYQTILLDNTPINLSIYWQEATETDATLQAAAPEIATATGATNFVNDDTAVVGILTATVDGTIYYTTDGSEPTTSSLVYTKPFEVTTDNEEGETVTVKAMTVKAGMTDSAVSSLRIVFKKKGEAAETVATPQVKARYDYTDANNGDTAEAGMYLLEILCDTEGADIYYTTDGSTPTAESQPYTGKVQVPAMTNGAATTIKAIAVKEGLNDSAIGSQTIQFSTDWWDNMCEGDEYAVGIAHEELQLLEK